MRHSMPVRNFSAHTETFRPFLVAVVRSYYYNDKGLI